MFRACRPFLFAVLSSAVVAAASTGSALAGPQGAFGTPATGASALTPIAVFGSDDRAPLAQIDAALNDKIGTLEIRGASICTAFCVAPDAIATASHCLFGTERTKAPDLEALTFNVGAGRNARASRIAGATASGIRQSIQSGTQRLRVAPPIDAASDWGIARLAEPVCGAGILPISEALREDVEIAAIRGQVFQVAMHRDQSARTLMHGGPCLIGREFPGVPQATIGRDFKNPDDVLLHTCDTGPGSSGSPMLMIGRSGPEVVGINVGTYVLSRMVQKNSDGEREEVNEAIANTAVASVRFKHAVEQVSLFTGTVRPAKAVPPWRSSLRRAAPEAF